MYKPRGHQLSDRISLASEISERAAATVRSPLPSPEAASVVNAEEPAAVAAPWLKSVVIFGLLFGVVWLSLYTAYAMLPFIRPGSVVIAYAKLDTLVKGQMFGPQDRNRVMIFGNSKLLSALRPPDLDAAIGSGFRSYNLGLPGEVHFLPILEAALEAGNIPSHVLLTIPWDDKSESDALADILRNDNALASTLFPFRNLPREAALFAFQNLDRLSDARRDVEDQRAAMLHDRGWYFIKSQSHYQHDRLPDNYALPTDHPTRAEPRLIAERSQSRDRLERLARQHGFQVLIVPGFFRAGEAAPPPAADNARLAVISDRPLIRVLGPDYFIYPPALFADPQHMNPAGAHAYTADLAKLLKASGAFD
ncbi:hypothetical protein [Bradyrhizobium sp.]|uniref:hypothetical protein n=1 Tax=Bradyrhizobium sp. TaxID=376 RepID=UPI002DDCC0DA|nr:hypothetical protein [Bradyrhizobium sp.]HEV2156693.1 hypothetical protein [Bradyrhizobium sp.]